MSGERPERPKNEKLDSGSGFGVHQWIDAHYRELMMLAMALELVLLAALLIVDILK